MSQGSIAALTEQGLSAAEAPPAENLDLSAVDPADERQFENALAMEGAPYGISMTASNAIAETSSATLGDAILKQLETLKSNSAAMQGEILQTLGKEDLKPSDMLRVQYQLMSVSLEIQTTSNMAHHGVEDVKTVMRGQ